MAQDRRMLGKLETVFAYMSHFLLYSWPEWSPGILFLADSGGTLLQAIPMQEEQTWNSPSFPFQPGDNVAEEASGALREALRSRSVVIRNEHPQDPSAVWAVVPLLESDGRPRAVIGLVAPNAAVDFDLASYVRGIEPLIRMGYDAYILHAASEIIMNVNRHERAVDLMQSAIEQISEIINKGYCSAVRLDEKGCLVPQDRLTTEPGDRGKTHLEQITSRLLDQPIKSMKSPDGRLVAVPITCDGKPLYALFLHLSPEDANCCYDVRDLAFLQTVGEKISYALMRAAAADEMRREAQKKDLLYQLSMKIQASIDVNEVLSQIIHSIEQLYPYFSVELFLTVETNTSLPVKPLRFQDGQDEYSRRAYMEGRMLVQHSQTEDRPETVVAAPLLGKQGIYGVLKLTAGEYVSITDNEREYISILAETAGTAFENAQLYQQSRNLVRELRMINEMARRMNKSLKLDELLTIVRQTLQQTFRPEYCAIIQRSGGDDRLVVLASSDEQQTGLTLSAETYPLSEVIQHRKAVILTHAVYEDGEFPLIPYMSLMAVPLLTDAEVSGALVVADTRPDTFSYNDLKLLEIYGQHASLALTNAMLHQELERMVITDNLTGLFTRRYLNQQIQSSMERDGYGSLLLFDIDYFKEINDTYGHQVGDEVLTQVARLIRQSVRESDVTARWGGEEIAVYLPRTDLGGAYGTAERIRRVVAECTQPKVTVSCGLSVWPCGGGPDSVDSLFHRADMALYEAKNTGRNQVRVYTR